MIEPETEDPLEDLVQSLMSLDIATNNAKRLRDETGGVGRSSGVFGCFEDILLPLPPPGFNHVVSSAQNHLEHFDFELYDDDDDTVLPDDVLKAVMSLEIEFNCSATDLVKSV